MSTNFPGSLDTLTNPQSTDSVATVSHAAQHANANDAIEALQAKVGADNSAVTTSHDYKLSAVTGSDKAASKATTDAHSARTDNPHSVTASQVGLGNVDNTSDATKNAAVATFTNKTIDADDNTISELETDNFKADVIDTDVDLTANSDTRIPSQKAVRTYVEANGGQLSYSYVAQDDIDGSATPAAVFYNGTLISPDADVAVLAKFLGFTDGQNTFDPSTFLNSTYKDANSGSSFSISVNAGTNRVLFVYINVGTTVPTGVTYGGVALTKADETGSGAGWSLWYLAIGDSGVSQNATLAITGGSWSSNGSLVYAVFDNIDQSSPVNVSDDGGNSVDIDPTVPLTSVLVFTGNGAGTAITLGSSLTENAAHSGTGGFSSMRFKIGSKKLYDTGSSQTLSVTAGGSGTVGVAVNLIDPVATLDVQVSGVKSGFSGLTPGEFYYLSGTPGSISLTPGSTSVKVGKAVSATELLIVHQ